MNPATVPSVVVRRPLLRRRLIRGALLRAALVRRGLAFGLLASFFAACNLGPFPAFLERLDPLDPVEGDVKGWISVDDEKSQVLVLSESGRFLHTQVGRDTSVELQTGDFSIAGGEFTMTPDLRYVFPSESGPVSDRLGAHPTDPEGEITAAATLEEETLTLEGIGEFISTTDFVSGLDLESVEGRGCLLRFVQLSVRTAQARIRNLGGGGTVIYHENMSSFSGFLSGSESIVVENLLSPDTTIGYDGFQDFPEVRFDGSFVSHVNTSGDGTLDQFVRVTVFGKGTTSEQGAGGQGGGEGELGVLAAGRLVYGPTDPIRIEQADVVGGSYDFELDRPRATSDNFSWEFLQDLDLRSCDPRF